MIENKKTMHGNKSNRMSYAEIMVILPSSPLSHFYRPNSCPLLLFILFLHHEVSVCIHRLRFRGPWHNRHIPAGPAHHALSLVGRRNVLPRFATRIPLANESSTPRSIHKKFPRGQIHSSAHKDHRHIHPLAHSHSLLSFHLSMVLAQTCNDTPCHRHHHIHSLVQDAPPLMP